MQRHLREVSALRHFINGMFVATLMCLILFMCVDWDFDNSAWIGVFGSIFVALMTLAAAWIALRGNRLQIAQAYEIQETARLNSLMAAKAVLPVVLADMTRIAENNLRLNFVPGHGPINDTRPEATSFISLPTELIQPFKECIAYADTQSQERMANLLRHFQVAQSRHTYIPVERLEPMFKMQEWTLELNISIGRAIDWTVIYALTVDMFKFARGSKMPIPSKIDLSKVIDAFMNAGLSPEKYQNLMQVINERAENYQLERE